MNDRPLYMVDDYIVQDEVVIINTAVNSFMSNISAYLLDVRIDTYLNEFGQNVSKVLQGSTITLQLGKLLKANIFFSTVKFTKIDYINPEFTKFIYETEPFTTIEYSVEKF
jgi:hypothetical protein